RPSLLSDEGRGPVPRQAGMAWGRTRDEVPHPCSQPSQHALPPPPPPRPPAPAALQVPKILEVFGADRQPTRRRRPGRQLARGNEVVDGGFGATGERGCLPDADHLGHIGSVGHICHRRTSRPSSSLLLSPLPLQLANEHSTAPTGSRPRLHPVVT